MIIVLLFLCKYFRLSVNACILTKKRLYQRVKCLDVALIKTHYLIIHLLCFLEQLSCQPRNAPGSSKWSRPDGMLYKTSMQNDTSEYLLNALAFYDRAKMSFNLHFF